MKISQITTFTSKRVLDRRQLNNVREIATKIDRPPTIIHHDNNYTAVRIGYVESKFEEVFFYNDKNNTSGIVIGKSEITVDRNSGKITKVDKPFFMPLKRLLKEAGEYFSFFNNNFDNPSVVKKNCLLEHRYVDESDGKTYITEKRWIRR